MLQKARPKMKFIHGEQLGQGHEGMVSRVSVELTRANRRHIRTMAMKKFHQRVVNAFPANRRLEMHFLIYEYLRTLNRERKAGLNLLPTWRVVELPSGEKALLKTLLPPLRVKDLTTQQRSEYKSDINRQKKIIRDAGVAIPFKDPFYPFIEPSTGKCVAMVNDAGTLVLPEWQTRLQKLALLPGIRRVLKAIGLIQGQIRKL